MRLDLEVLDLAVEILRDEARKAGDDTPSPVDGSWGEHCEHIADRIADIIDHLDPDNG